MSLFWVIKRVLSDKDKTIAILRSNVEKKDNKLEQMFQYMATVSNTQEKMVETIEKNQQKSETSLDKIFVAISNCKDVFNSMKYKDK